MGPCAEWLYNLNPQNAPSRYGHKVINLKQFLGMSYQGDCPEHQALSSPDTLTEVVS